MLIKKELKTNYKFFNIFCHFYNELSRDNIEVFLSKRYISLKLKNKNIYLNLDILSNDIEFKTVMKSVIVNLKNLRSQKNLFKTNVNTFKLIENIPQKKALTILLHFIIYSIKDDFYLDEDINEIEDHSFSMSLPQIHKHLYVSHDKDVGSIGNPPQSKILSETRFLMSNRTEQFGYANKKMGALLDSEYELLHINYKDTKIIEDQFITFKKLFHGDDFLLSLHKKLDEINLNALFSITKDCKHLPIIHYFLRAVSLLICSRIMEYEVYKGLKNKIILDLLQTEKNGNEKIIHKILYVVNCIDKNENSVDLYKSVTLMCISLYNGIEDKDSTINLLSTYSDKNHMGKLISVIDVIDSTILHFYIGNYLNNSLIVSIDENLMNIFSDSLNFNNFHNTEIKNKLFIRLDPKLNDGIYAILYDNKNDSLLIMFESNGMHRMNVLCSNFTSSDHKDYTLDNNLMFFSNVNEGYYVDVEYCVDTFYNYHSDLISHKVEYIQNMVFSIYNNFDSNEKFNIIFKNHVKNENLHVSYDKNKTYHFFWKKY
jgi:hypothetical protein